jgi:hypothetical protein
MSRELSSPVSTALTDEVIFPFFAIDFSLDSGALYVWNGNEDLVIGAKTYLGAGELISISAISETSEMSAQGATITLTGIPATFLSMALVEPYQGRECKIFFGVTNSAVDYVEIFSGFLDQMVINETFETAVITVTVENELIRLERPVVRRFTPEDQKSRFPGDLGLDFISDIQDKEIFFGKSAK